MSGPSPYKRLERSRDELWRRLTGATRAEHTVSLGGWEVGVTSIDAVRLHEEVRVAKCLGYTVEIRIVNGALETLGVKRVSA